MTDDHCPVSIDHLSEDDLVDLVRQGLLCPYTECQALGRRVCEDCREEIPPPVPASPDPAEGGEGR